MLKSMCLEFGQSDLKTIGRNRGFEPVTVASRELLEHVFLSEQGVASAMASLTPVEVACLHLLNALGEQTDLEFFGRLYPKAVTGSIYSKYNDRFKGLFQEVKARLIQRGLLLMGTLPEPHYPRGVTILERRRFRFPQAFGPLLPAPFQPRQLAPGATGRHRGEVLREKLEEILKLGSGSESRPAGRERWHWRLEGGELMLGLSSSGFQAKQLATWQQAQFKATVDYTNKALPEPFHPVPLFLYALSRSGADQWLAPADLEGIWNLVLSGAKAPEPQTVCEAAYEWGCVEKAESDGAALYRLPRVWDSQANSPPEAFLGLEDPQWISLRLERAPLAALERLCEIARLELVGGKLRASPNLVKLSHARAETLSDPIVGWLQERHPGFRNTLEKIEQRRGKLLVHENLLVAKVSDLALKVMLEKKFGAPGKLVALSREYVAFPSGLLAELESWMKKSGHVIRHSGSGDPFDPEEEEPESEEGLENEDD